MSKVGQVIIAHFINYYYPYPYSINTRLVDVNLAAY